MYSIKVQRAQVDGGPSRCSKAIVVPQSPVTIYYQNTVYHRLNASTVIRNTTKPPSHPNNFYSKRNGSKSWLPLMNNLPNTMTSYDKAWNYKTATTEDTLRTQLNNQLQLNEKLAQENAELRKGRESKSDHAGPRSRTKSSSSTPVAPRTKRLPRHHGSPTRQ